MLAHGLFPPASLGRHRPQLPGFVGLRAAQADRHVSNDVETFLVAIRNIVGLLGVASLLHERVCARGFLSHLGSL
jgi:hypothetical protein